MRLYTKFGWRQKKKGLFVVLVVCIVTWIALQIQGLNVVAYKKELLIHKHTSAYVYGQRQTGNKRHNETNVIRGQRLGRNKYGNTIRNKDGNKTSMFDKVSDTQHDIETSESKVNPWKRRINDNDDGGSKVVFFIGGGKSGSTTLAVYLKHDPNNWKQWDPNGQFMDGGKEFCWSKSHQSKEQFWKHYKTHGSHTAVFALDACPQAVERVHFERMVNTFPNASYLMLVRDPVDRVISHMNDINDGHNRSIDALLKTHMTGNQLAKRLSMFGKIIQTAYSVLPKHKILIISNPDMTRQPQQTIDKVMKHIGGQPKTVTLVEANKRKSRKTYQIPSNSTLKWLKDMFYKDWQLFKNISGQNDIETVYM